MYRIENFRTIDNILLKKSNYSILFGDNPILLYDICASIDYYFSQKRLTKEDKLLNENSLSITDFENGEKIQVSSVDSIFFSNNSIENEITLGTKTNLYKLLSEKLKEKMDIEPQLITMNSLLEDIDLEEFSQELKKKITKYSDYEIFFAISPLSASDIVKKIEVSFLQNENEEIHSYLIENLEKFKLKIGIFEEMYGEDTDKVYIFYYPENNLSIEEQKKLKFFLKNISKEHKIIIATSSKYLFDFEYLDNLNLYFGSKLVNAKSEEEILESLYNEYPLFLEKKEINKKLKFVLSHYLLDMLNDFELTNKIKSESEIVYLTDYEFVFLLIYYLDFFAIKYSIDISYDNENVFSNYIKDKFT